MTKLLVLLVPSLVGCVAPIDDSTTEQALAGEGSLWPGGVVHVCWETGLASDNTGQAQNPHSRADWATLSRVVRDTMRSTWGRAANLEFTGFGDCPSNVATDNPGTIAINMARNGNDAGGNTDIGYRSTTWTRMRLDPEQYGGAATEKFRGQIIHETGHGLGFHHEWDRADNPHNTGCTVADGNYEANTDTYYGTQFDKLSIMNFSYDQGDPSCALPTPFRLSAWDIVGAQNAYGRRKAGTLVAASGNCLDQSLSTSKLQSWECHGQSNQVWKVASSGTISSTSFATVPATTGGQLFGAAQTLAANQSFHATNGYELRGIGDMCLDVPSGHYANGVGVQIFPCTSGTNQRWRAFSDGTIRPTANTSYCLDVPYGSAYAGNLLQLFTCNGGAAQRFTFTNAGEIKFGSLCLDVVGGRPNANSRIQLYSCKAAGDETRVNQLWHLTMGIANANNLCVETGTSALNGAAVVQQTCTAAANQTWDFYPNSFGGF
jgi:hypothetical protein